MSQENKVEKCWRKDCTHDAKYAVVLELRPNEATHGKSDPAISTAIIYVCEEHSNVQWDDVVDARGWQRLLDGFRVIGRAAPSKLYSNVALVPISQEQIVKTALTNPEKN